MSDPRSTVGAMTQPPSSSTPMPRCVRSSTSSIPLTLRTSTQTLWSCRSPYRVASAGSSSDRKAGYEFACFAPPHELSKRLGASKVSELVARAEAGESVRSIARDVGVANSALTRMLREEGVEISKRKVSADEAAMLKAEYELGATVRELEKRFNLSHGAVLRALNSQGTEMRPNSRRK